MTFAKPTIKLWFFPLISKWKLILITSHVIFIYPCQNYDSRLHLRFIQVIVLQIVCTRGQMMASCSERRNPLDLWSGFVFALFSYLIFIWRPFWKPQTMSLVEPFYFRAVLCFDKTEWFAMLCDTSAVIILRIILSSYFIWLKILLIRTFCAFVPNVVSKTEFRVQGWIGHLGIFSFAVIV